VGVLGHMGKPWLPVLMPAHNEETGLERSASQVMALLSQLRVPSEILIVDNCGTDRAGEIADARRSATPETT
jgi:glycosyltransferase involved in cell wall biosynthesis